MCQKQGDRSSQLWKMLVKALYLVIPVQYGFRGIFEAVQGRNYLFVGRPLVEEVRIDSSPPMLGCKYIDFFRQRRIAEKKQQLLS